MLRRCLLHFARIPNALQRAERSAISAALKERTFSRTDESLVTSRSVDASQGMAARLTMESSNVTSLQQFFDECRRLLKEVGYATSRDRNALRGEFAKFWHDNIVVATAACNSARDVGFVSFYGVSDSRLTLPASCIAALVHLLVRDKAVCSALDTTVSLRYIGREISRILTAPHCTSDEKDVIASDLVALFTEHGIEQLNRLFLKQGHSVGKGDDAIHGLEFILSLANGHPLAAELTERLLLAAAADDLRMTSTIACFSILRISLPKLRKSVAADLCVSLLRSVKKKDSKFVNPFHFVKIVVTMSRIDSQYLLNENMWAFVLSKCCIFMCNVTPAHRDLLVMSIRKMLKDRGLDHLLTDLAMEVQHQYPEEYERLILLDIVPKQQDV